jgi:tRNA A-37 threonylcarbamoyl transferase component Bud32
MGQSSTREIIIKKKYIIKKYKEDKLFLNERDFYLNIPKYNLEFIPKLFGYNNKNRILIIENVGKNINKKILGKNINIIKILEDKLVSVGYYHNDMRMKNILLSKDNKFYLIDFEKTSNDFTDFQYGGDRDNIYSFYF